ncbi:hypothetical protein THRCLA_09152 [Thraustotheca clavata]|uniref:Uncharacterized protein n=1 Tax=Thraustotheca clavata TaxID=74557 RepID=A0A1V9YYX7_9STRA|nr:hypothetical protein THRCLA_09152 [Thraustotheca clavata]
MKEFLMQKLFELPTYRPIRVFQRRSNSVGDTPPSEWFDNIFDESMPLPEGVVLVSPVMNHAFQSPTPPSPPPVETRTKRAISLESQLFKGTRWAMVNGLQKRIRARLTWSNKNSNNNNHNNNNTHRNSNDSDEDTVVPSVIIETVSNNDPRRPSSTLEFFDKSIPSPPLDAISEEDGKKHIHFSQAPMVRHIYFAMESYEEWVIRVSNGYAECDIRPAHVKLHAFCTKSMTYLKYRKSPCAEVFSLGAHDISMWRTLGHHNWLDDTCPNPEPDNQYEVDNVPLSPKKDPLDDEPPSPLTDGEFDDEDYPISEDEDIHIEIERVDIVPKTTNLVPLLEIINATINNGDLLFTIADLKHFCCELEYPTKDGEEEEDGWC